MFKINCLVVALFVLTSPTAFGSERIQPKFESSEAALAALKPLDGLKKDEFEKTADFHKRVCAGTFKAISTDEKSSLILTLENGEYATQFKYNADKQGFEAFLGRSDHYLTEPSKYEDRWKGDLPDTLKYDALILGSNYHEDSKTYTGSNAYGQTKQIKVGFRQNALLFVPVQTYKTDIFLAANPQDAKKLSGNLRLAIFTGIQMPCFVSLTGHHSPTIDFPYDITTQEYGIIGKTKPEWIIYRTSDKEVLKRGKFK